MGCRRDGAFAVGLALPMMTSQTLACAGRFRSPSPRGLWSATGSIGSLPVVAGDDLLLEVQQVRRTASIFGVRATSRAVRKVAERAMEYDEAETRILAAQLLDELNRIPVLRP
jgi:hypothetical protein